MRAILGLSIFVFATIACGDSKPDDPPPPDLQGTAIGPAGGIVRSADGSALLSIPRNALAQETRISIEKKADTYELSPDGLVFALPASLSLKYTGTSTDVTVVKVLADGAVIAQPTFFDADTKTATAALGGFSTYTMDNSIGLPPPVIRLNATHSSQATSLSWEYPRSWSTGQVRVERAGPFLQPPRDSDWSVLTELPIHHRAWTDSGPFTVDAIYWYRIRLVTPLASGVAASTFIGTFNDSPARPLALAATVRDTTSVDLVWDLFAVNLVEEFRIWLYVDGTRSARPLRLSNLRSAETYPELPFGHYYSFRLEAMREGLVAATETVHVVIGDFAITAIEPQTLSIRPGETGETSIRLDRGAQFTADVNYELVSSISGITATFEPRPGTPNREGATISVAAGTPAGRYDLRIRATSGASSSEHAITIEVPPDNGFDFSILPNPVRMKRNSTGAYQIEVRRFGEFMERVDFEYVDPPAFLRNSSPPNEGGGYLIASTIDNGTYELRIRGTSGAFVHEEILNVEIYGVPEARYFSLLSLPDGQVMINWQPSFNPDDEYLLEIDGVEHTRLASNVGEYLFDAGTDMHGYRLKTVRNGEESDGHQLYSFWIDPVASGDIWDVIALCEPAAPSCEPVYFSRESSAPFSFVYVAAPTNCAQIEMELIIDGSSYTRTEPVFPGRDSALVEVTPPAGASLVGLRANGFPGWGCADAAGTISSWAGRIYMRDL